MLLRWDVRFSVPATRSKEREKMKRVSVICLLGVAVSLSGADVEVPWAKVLEKLWNPSTFVPKLVAEKFTKGVFTVPGYFGAEHRDSSDPPFDPTPECGDQFMNLTSGSFDTITSPNYPGSYPPSLQCEWVIEGIPGTVVEATFFDVVTQPWLFSFTDYVLISDTGSWDNYRRFAGDVNHKLPFTVVSKGSRLAIRFVSSRWLNFRGFKMTYVVRPMKASDDAPATNEYGSAFNNDLVAVCSSKPIVTERLNAKLSRPEIKAVQERVEHQIRIVNGVETLPHQYPFMVIILTNQGAFCGGSLIDANHILTAAHCLENSEASEELQSVDLVFGAYNLSNRAENLYSRQYRSVQYPEIASNVFIHPHYDSRSGANDIAIIRVNKVKITKYVQPVFLPSVYTESNPFTGWNLRTVGWGSVEGDRSKIKLTPTIREAPATVVPTVTCRDAFSGSVTGNHVCTKNPIVSEEPEPEPSTTEIQPTSTVHVEETSTTTSNSSSEEPSNTILVFQEGENVTTSIQYQSPCHGDSGGPLLVEFLEGHEEDVNPNNAGLSDHDCVNARRNGGGNEEPVKQPPDTVCQRPKDRKEKWFVQVGVLSFGSRVCGRKVPVVYTRVTAYLQWIAYITGRHG